MISWRPARDDCKVLNGFADLRPQEGDIPAMPVAMCAKCEKLISISDIPGGNPFAKGNPEIFALAYGICDRCKAVYCDKCIEANGGKCPKCGQGIKIVS